MESIYRCMRCGNNITSDLYEDEPKCNICEVPTILVLVTEANKHIIPMPTNPIDISQVGFNDPSLNCRCESGFCPCGKFVAHPVSEAWDPNNPHIF